jgi:hypothetical protein
MEREYFYDSEALFERLTAGIRRDPKPVAFLFGSAITAPPKHGQIGF